MQRKHDEYLNHYTAIIALYVNAQLSAVVVIYSCSRL